MYYCELYFQDTKLDTFIKRLDEFVRESKSSAKNLQIVTNNDDGGFWKNCRLDIIEKQDDSAFIVFADKDLDGFIKNEDDLYVKRVGNELVLNDAPLKDDKGSQVSIRAKHYKTNELWVALYWPNKGCQALYVFSHFASHFYHVDLEPVVDALSGNERRKAPKNNKLSRRELEVIEQVILGASRREIASTLMVAETTIISHLKSIGIKLGIASSGIKKIAEEWRRRMEEEDAR